MATKTPLEQAFGFIMVAKDTKGFKEPCGTVDRDRRLAQKISATSFLIFLFILGR